MQTSLPQAFLETSEGATADRILRSCVHCGFCTATCPTYQLLGDELDGPRGRIYLIKQMLEEQPVSRLTRAHLDRCLTCRSCETTCPSGVRYSRLLEIGRQQIEQRAPRSLPSRFLRWSLRQVLPHRRRIGVLLRLGQTLRPALPGRLQRKIPRAQKTGTYPNRNHPRRMLLFTGCVQSAATPNTNAATARVLDQLGISLLRVKGEGCCGAVSLHLAAVDEGLDYVRRNIDAWWPHVETGLEAIVVTASGCGATIKEYAELLRDDPMYAGKAERISSLARDLSEILAAEELSRLVLNPTQQKIAFHAPCTLQHGQQLHGGVERILERLGFILSKVTDPHLCCGSAGTYSILQPELSLRLLNNKLAGLQAEAPELIATANIGCQLRLESGSEIPVKHWIELIDQALGGE